MGEARSRQVIIAGAGIAGLTAALAFAQRGFSVQVFERAPKLDEAGAVLDPAFQQRIETYLKHFFWLAEAVAEKKMAAVASEA